MDSLKGKLGKLAKSIGYDRKTTGSSPGTAPIKPDNSRLCALCAGVTLQALESGYRHHPDYPALKQSAQNCPLCAILLRSLQTEDEFPAIVEEELKDAESAISLEASRYPVGEGWEEMLYLKCGTRIKILSFTVLQDPKKGQARQFSDRADSDENFAWLSETLNKCLTTHAGCTSGDPKANPIAEIPQPLPTRVVDVGPPDGSAEVKLVETGRKPDRYVALSHCWGKAKIHTTTTKNVDEHKKAIPFHYLSKTFQNAVTVTRRLGMRYLWIDSLCILQDSKDDWAKESSYMGDIYRTATFTIAAAGSEASAIGCFVDRKPDALAPIRIQYLSRKKELAMLQIGLPKGSLRSGLDDGPLQSRCWCLQERVLSRRTIHYCASHIVWECQTTSIAEDGSYLDGSSSMEAFQLKLEDKIGTSGHYLHPLQKRWRSIVQDYTHRDITKGTDKLPAISGLAQKVQEVTKDKYLAGLWLQHLHNDLFWFAMDDMKPESPYRAPTWSWAAYAGEITYDAVMDMKTIVYDSSLKSVDGECSPSTANPLGEVSKGYIQLSGRIRTAVFSIKEPRKEDFVAKNAREIYQDAGHELEQHGRSLGFGALDAVASVEREVLCLGIAVKTSPSAAHHQALLIEKTGTENSEYRRIGAAFIRPLDWFDNCAYEAITLV